MKHKEPGRENLVLIGLANSQGSEHPMHANSLAKAFDARIHKNMKMMAQTKY